MKAGIDGLLSGGILAGIKMGTSRGQVEETFGPPDVDTPQRKSYPAMLVYGAFEFRFRNDQLTAIALDLVNGVPRSVGELDVHLGELEGMDRLSVERLLRAHGVSWSLDEVMSEDGVDVMVTSIGAHLAFDSTRLIRVVSASVR